MGHLLMNEQGRGLKAYFEMVKRKQLTLRQVSHQIGLSFSIFIVEVAPPQLVI